MPETVVFLPGLMCDARLFGPQIADLSRDHAVMTAPITQGERIEEIASSVLDMAPNRLDTNPLAETPQVAAMRDPQIIRARAGKLDEVMAEELKPNYLVPGPHRKEILELVMDMARGLGAEVFIRQSRALQRRRDQQSTLRRISVPTLVLCGEEDALCPVKRHVFMAEMIPKAQLTVIEGAGHLPPLERPEETTRALRDWLSAPLLLR
jgi:pimeloyl-ACP methyl ester carboxylesterase